MSLNPSFAERVEGCLLGLALADAVGAVFEGSPRERLRSRFDAPADAFEFAASGNLRYTDDGQMALALARYLSELPNESEIEPLDLMRAFANEYESWRGYGRGARTLIEAFRDGGDYEFLAQTLFPGGSLGNGAAMRSAMIGLRFRGDRERIRTQAQRSALPTHRHPVGIEGAELIALAASIAIEDRELDPSSLAKDLRPFSRTETFARRLDRLSQVRDVGDVDSLGNGIEAHESVPAALACFSLFANDYVEAVSLAIWQGGDTDTIAAMTGALVGARIGSRNLPTDALSRLEGGSSFLAGVRELATTFAQVSADRRMPFSHDLDSSPVDWAIDHPSAAKVFEELGIDYSCPGKSLAGQCERLGLDPAEVLRRLREAVVSDSAG